MDCIKNILERSEKGVEILYGQSISLRNYDEFMGAGDRLPSAMNLLESESSSISTDDRDAILDKSIEKPYRLTPFIVTFCEGTLTSIDIQSFIEMGLKIVRFKMTHVTRSDKIKMLMMLKNAVKWCCEKYEVTTWPIAISVDLPNACIRTGYLDDNNEQQIYLQEDTIIEITCDTKYRHRCDSHRIFIDDPYTLRSVKPGVEITIRFGEIVVFCCDVIDATTIKCKVVRGGTMESTEFVCIRGIKHIRPPLTKIDMELLEFAKEFQLDIVTLNSTRKSKTLKKIKDFYKTSKYTPLLISTICEQEGLDNIDDIIQESDGIILAREFLAYNIADKHQMIAIQLQVSAKCRKMGKPFYISGNILEQTMLNGTLSQCDLTDITNAVLEGSGIVLRTYNEPSNVIKTMAILDSVCRYTEPLTRQSDFWRMSLEFRMPVNAAEACILACALMAQQSNSLVVILPTVTGKTAKQLAHIAPQAIVLTISSNPVVARHLQLYRGIIPIIYDKRTSKDWYEEMDARIQFAVAYGVKHNLLKYGNTYIALRKANPTSSFCDHVSLWKVITEETMKHGCSYHHDDNLDHSHQQVNTVH